MKFIGIKLEEDVSCRVKKKVYKMCEKCVSKNNLRFLYKLERGERVGYIIFNKESKNKVLDSIRDFNSIISSKYGFTACIPIVQGSSFRRDKIILDEKEFISIVK